MAPVQTPWEGENLGVFNLQGRADVLVTDGENKEGSDFQILIELPQFSQNCFAIEKPGSKQPRIPSY